MKALKYIGIGLIIILLVCLPSPETYQAKVLDKIYLPKPPTGAYILVVYGDGTIKSLEVPIKKWDQTEKGQLITLKPND